MGNQKAYTEQETRDMFLDHVRDLVEYWDNTQADKTKALEGLAFSIMTLLDGEVIDVPGFRVSPICDKEDKEYYESKGEKYFDENVDIAGCLHEFL